MKRNQHVLSRPKKFVGIRKILISYFYFLPKHFATTMVRKICSSKTLRVLELAKERRRQKPQTFIKVVT